MFAPSIHLLFVIPKSAQPGGTCFKPALSSLPSGSTTSDNGH